MGCQKHLVTLVWVVMKMKTCWTWEFLQHWQGIAVVLVAIVVYVESPLKKIENILSYG